MSTERTIFLVRHAHAASRAHFGGDDRDRPLTQKGEAQALQLAEILGGEPIGRIMSSPARRCVDTVKPLSAVLAVAVDVEESLYEGHDIELPPGTGATVICAHGDNIPEVLTRLQVDYEECRKASTWRLDLDEAGNVVDATYQPPPAVDV